MATYTVSAQEASAGSPRPLETLAVGVPEATTASLVVNDSYHIDSLVRPASVTDQAISDPRSSSFSVGYETFQPGSPTLTIAGMSVPSADGWVSALGTDIPAMVRVGESVCPERRWMGIA